ncbi:hypothetical protein [Advenella sp. EE-W14]|uniref:hypothetical protein n=1 Tax=Advenella sp. EE-W14 TaxID=2722705 RepID=UPI00145CBB0D|nr:hypothetical protein [Advenella sp. EE-W14]
MSTTTLQEARIAKPAHAVTAGFFDTDGFALVQRVAKAFSSSGLVPAQYQGDNGIANCMIALNMAQRMNADPMMVMQNLYMVHGQPAWSSKFLIATVNACGRYSSLRYEWKNEDKPDSDEYGCRAWAVEKESGERLNGIWVTWKMVKAEGWSSKNGSKWKTMPDQMFMYRAASFWVRTNAPELSMGFQTQEEAIDTIDATQDEDGRIVVNTESLRKANSEQAKPKTKKEVDAQDVDIRAVNEPRETAAVNEANIDQETGEVLQDQGQAQASILSDEDDDPFLEKSPTESSSPVKNYVDTRNRRRVNVE